jgi:hypothetical protein
MKVVEHEGVSSLPLRTRICGKVRLLFRDLDLAHLLLALIPSYQRYSLPFLCKSASLLPVVSVGAVVTPEEILDPLSRLESEVVLGFSGCDVLLLYGFPCSTVYDLGKDWVGCEVEDVVERMRETRWWAKLL